MDSDEFERMFGGMDEELEEKLFQQAMASMVKLFRSFRRNGLNSWEAACIIAAWLKNSVDPPIKGDKSDGED